MSSPPPLYRLPTIFHGIRTNLILNGYIRLVALPMLTITEFPETVETMILLYVGETFKYYGTYSYVIDDKRLINKILNVDNGEKVSCEMLNIASFDWELYIFPNGDSKINNGSVDLFLKLLTYTDDKLIICWRVSCDELASSHTHIDTWSQRDMLGWPYGTLSTKELKDNIMNNKLNTLTFSVELQILRIYREKDVIYGKEDEKEIIYKHQIFYDVPFKKQSFEWKINSKLLGEFRNGYNGKQFESDIFNKMWLLQCVPNDENDFDVTIVLCSLPHEISYICVNLEININEMNIDYSDQENFDIIKNCELGWNEERLVLSFDEFKTYKIDAMTIKVKIEVLELYHNDGFKIHENEWNKYVIEYEKNEMNTIDFKKIQQAEISRKKRKNKVRFKNVKRENSNDVIIQINKLLAIFDC